MCYNSYCNYIHGANHSGPTALPWLWCAAHGGAPCPVAMWWPGGAAGAEARASWFAVGARQVGCGALCALFGHRAPQTTAWQLPLCPGDGAVKAA